VSPRIQINSGVEADKAAREFAASTASAYRLSTCKITVSDLNSDLPGLDRLLKHKQKLRKLWHETRDPACKTAVNWVTKTIRRMTRRKTLEMGDVGRYSQLGGMYTRKHRLLQRVVTHSGFGEEKPDRLMQVPKGK
jgi:hypothetical protein